MAKYRRKTVIVDAWRYHAAHPPLKQLCPLGSRCPQLAGAPAEILSAAHAHTENGVRVVEDGDYVICNQRGELEVEQAQIFECYYEPIPS